MITLRSRNYINRSEGINVHRRDHFNKIALHQHDFIELVYIAGGSSTSWINQQEYLLERGDLVLLNIGDIHRFTPRDSISFINMLIHPGFLDRRMPDENSPVDLLKLPAFRAFEARVLKIPPFIRVPTSDLLNIESLMGSIIHEYNAKSIGYLTVLKGHLHILITQLLRIVEMEQQRPSGSRNHLRDTFPVVIDYIDRNYQNKITLSELASNSFFNPSYFGQVFKTSFGMTPMEYVNKKRIHEAARILIEHDATAEQVCFMVGFKDRKQFYKLFKQYKGLTPGQFRKSKPVKRLSESATPPSTL